MILMKRYFMVTALAALSFVLIACGNKQATQTADQQADSSAVEATAEEPQLGDGEEADDGVGPGETALPAIRDVWAQTPISPVAADGTATIGNIAFAFCQEFSDYMPNKSLVEYLAFPDRYKEDDATYLIVDKKKNGYLSCYMKADLDWGVECCCWNLAGDKKLVAFWLTENHLSWAKAEQLLAFYEYDPDSDMLEPVPEMSRSILDVLERYDSFGINLPIEGKDIAALCHNTETNHDHAVEAQYIFRFNGTGFKAEKVKETEL
jgi:hypothetical protein